MVITEAVQKNRALVLGSLPVPRAGSPFPFVIASEVEQFDATLGPYTAWTACKQASNGPRLHGGLSTGVRDAAKPQGAVAVVSGRTGQSI